ncbi:MAG: four helix bundle protein [Chloroflexi bacterium]|nr:four helix bundle protein [Chloroflexota bacterium]
MDTQQTGIRDYKDLIVWQKSIDLVTQVYAVTAIFPNREQYGLISQMQRAAVSISSNIAEGQSRASAAEFHQFLSISLSESPKVLPDKTYGQELRVSWRTRNPIDHFR